MSSDAASSEPRKRRWKAWLIGLACVVAAATIALLASAPKPEPVRVWFVRATNELGVKKLVFEGTNGLPRQVLICYDVFRGASRAKTRRQLWDTYSPGTSIDAPAATNFHFALKAPSNGVPFHVEWTFFGASRRMTRWGTFRKVCEDFFDIHDKPRMANRFAPHVDVHYIPSSEI